MAHAPSYTMGYKKQNKSNEFAPGPGAYNPALNYSKENLGGVKIGTSKRQDLLSSDAPGPGNYNISAGINSSSYAFGTGSRRDNKMDPTPGPGHYKAPCYVGNVPRYCIPDRNESLRYI